METSKLYEELAVLEQKLSPLVADFKIRAEKNGNNAPTPYLHQQLAAIIQLEENIIKCKSKICIQAINMKTQEEPFAKLEEKIRSRQESIVGLEQMLAKMEEDPEHRLKLSFRDRHMLKQRIAEEQIYLQADINSNVKRDVNVPNKYEEQISNQAALIRDLEKKLAKLETETNSKNKIFEKKLLARLELEQEQHEKHNSTLTAALESMREETKSNKASIDELNLKLQSHLSKQEENEKLLDSFKAQLKDRDDQIALLELGNILDSCKIQEKDDLLKELEERVSKLN